MPEYLKGNYSVDSKDQPKNSSKTKKQSPQQEFERRALAKLGGSIAFIAKPSLVWNGDDDGKPGDSAS
jgi:hypothetical protein